MPGWTFSLVPENPGPSNRLFRQTFTRECSLLIDLGFAAVLDETMPFCEAGFFSSLVFFLRCSFCASDKHFAKASRDRCLQWFSSPSLQRALLLRGCKFIRDSQVSAVSSFFANVSMCWAMVLKVKGR